MIPMTSVEVLQDLLKFGKDLLPLLSEKKLDNVIAGLKEAREIVAKHKEIQIDIVAAQEALAKAEALNEQLNSKQEELAIDEQSIAFARSNLAARESEVAAKEKANAELQAKLNKAFDAAEKKQAKLDGLLAKAETDSADIETAKAAIQAKLAKLSEVA
jgi:uncharacterized protein YPO0396